MSMRKNAVEKVGVKYDNEKPDWSLLPLVTVEQVVKVLTYGARRYGRENWKLVRPKHRYLSACLRHLTQLARQMYGLRASLIPPIITAPLKTSWWRRVWNKIIRWLK